VNWDEIYRSTKLEDLHWYPGEVDELLQRVVAEGWLTGRSVLDVGAGQGTDAIYLASKGFDVTCLDLSGAAREVALAEAQKSGVRLNYVVGNVLEAPFADGAFDSVVERGCFHHIALGDRPRYARQIARLLRSGGSYLYRSFTANSQFRTPPEELLTEDAVRAVFDPYFEFVHFETYMARGMGGRSVAEMHGALLKRR
jgi:2-polyprenyl-3-methyl-5-hydroxy-6-metoxy-1,4-benzoquinol methylase